MRIKRLRFTMRRMMAAVAVVALGVAAVRWKLAMDALLGRLSATHPLAPHQSHRRSLPDAPVAGRSPGGPRCWSGGRRIATRWRRSGIAPPSSPGSPSRPTRPSRSEWVDELPGEQRRLPDDGLPENQSRAKPSSGQYSTGEPVTRLATRDAHVTAGNEPLPGCPKLVEWTPTALNPVEPDSGSLHSACPTFGSKASSMSKLLLAALFSTLAISASAGCQAGCRIDQRVCPANLPGQGRIAASTVEQVDVLHEWIVSTGRGPPAPDPAGARVASAMAGAGSADTCRPSLPCLGTGDLDGEPG